MLVYTRNAVLSLRNSLKVINRTSHGSLPRPLSSELWQRLKFYNLLAPAGGQRGGNHRRRTKKSSGIAITVFESNANCRTRQRGERNGVNYSNLLNIQIDTSSVNSKRAPTVQSLSEQTLSQGNQPKNFQRSKILIAHLNIRSLKNRDHLVQLQTLVSEKGFDVLAISESWLNSTVSNVEVEIGGYKLFRQDRLKKRGGGVCVSIFELRSRQKS